MLPALAQLEITPEIFRILFDELTEAEATWKPAPDRWSIAEVMEHLSHVEAHGFRDRIEKMIETDVPELLEYDQDAYARSGQYSGRDFEDSFAHWEDQRETNIEFLRTLKEDVLPRQARHEKLGIITVAELLHEWAFHDMGHIRHVIEILRAQRHYPEMGPYRALYHINP